MVNSRPRYKFSRQRQRILELLKSTDTHPTADWVYTQLKPEFPKLSLGTVYRNLNILVKQGQVRELRCGSTFDRFDGNVKPHYHFTCSHCGQIVDLHLQLGRDVFQRILDETGCLVEGHTLDCFGICSVCRSRDDVSRSPALTHQLQEA